MGHCDFYYDRHKPCKGDASPERLLWRGLPSNMSHASLSRWQETKMTSIKKTSHATILVFYKREQFGPAPKPRVYTDQTKRKRSLQSTGVCQFIRQYRAYVKRPALTSFSRKIQAEWFKYTESLYSEGCVKDQD